MINPISSILNKSLELNGQSIGISNFSTGTTNLDTKALVRYSNNAVITSNFFIQKDDELLFILNKEIPSNKYITFKGGIYKVGTVDNTVDGYYTHYTKYNNKLATYTIELDKTNLSISTSKTYQLVPTCKQDNLVMPSSTVVYTSLNPTIATVSPDGLITGIGEGITTIKATYEGVVATCNITVVQIAYSIVLSEYLKTIKEKETYQLITTCTIDGVIDIEPVVTYTSLNTNVASVSSSGLITGLLEGVATITCTYNGIQISLSLTVEKDVVANKPFKIVGSDTIKKGISSTYNVQNIDGSELGLRAFRFEIDYPSLVQVVSFTDNSVVLKALIADEFVELKAIDKLDPTQFATFEIETYR